MCCLAACQTWGLGSYVIFMGTLFLKKYIYIKCNLKNTTRKHTSKLYVGFAETSVNKWSTNIYCGSSNTKKTWTYCINNSFLEKAPMWATRYLHQLPFSQLWTCIRSLSDCSSHAPRPSLRVIPLLVQSCTSPQKSLRAAAYKNWQSYSRIGKELSYQEQIYGYCGVCRARQNSPTGGLILCLHERGIILAGGRFLAAFYPSGDVWGKPRGRVRQLPRLSCGQPKQQRGGAGQTAEEKREKKETEQEKRGGLR